MRSQPAICHCSRVAFSHFVGHPTSTLASPNALFCNVCGWRILADVSGALHPREVISGDGEGECKLLETLQAVSMLAAGS